MTTKKVNWALADKRIRRRRTDWTKVELEQLEAAFMKLPDLSDQVDYVTMQQPALAKSGSDDGDPLN
jgi:hypothetical protein